MKIIKVAQEELSQEELSDDWQDDVDYLEELDLTLEQLLDRHNIECQSMTINNKEILVIYDATIYVTDEPYDSWPRIKEANEWINSMNEMELEIYVPEEEHNFWESPEYLYHATNIDNIESIKRTGLRVEDRTRGISNRGMGAAIFTSFSPEDISMYGDIIIEIDTVQMKKDGYMPRVSGESPLEESDRKSKLAYIIGLENYIPDEYAGEGYSDSTIAIYDNIPRKYLRIIQ